MKPRVVVAGGGFAGLETLFCLRYKLGDAVDLTLVNDSDHFLFKPNTIYIPFGADPEKFKVDLKRPARKKNVELVVGQARAVDPENRKLMLADREVGYDYLVLATGATMREAEIPGLGEYAVTIWTPEQMLRLREELQRLVERARTEERVRLLFLVPPNNKCSGPLYELVMMTDTWLVRQGVREYVDITWTTYEDSYIQAFGPRLNTVVTEEFEDRGVTGMTGMIVDEVQPHQVLYRDGTKLGYDLLVSFPPYVAKETFEGLPCDQRGFLKVEPDSRRLKTHDRIFAVGDAADFPIKQAYLALLQGDAAAEHVAAELEGRPVEARFCFEPMSMCVMEEMNKATFAQVPLRYTSDPDRPVMVDVADTEHYKVGVSALWRPGKKLLGYYLPWRFGNGEPFHMGLAWDVMDLGLKVMSKVLAS